MAHAFKSGDVITLKTDSGGGWWVEVGSPYTVRRARGPLVRLAGEDGQKRDYLAENFKRYVAPTVTT